MKQKAMPAGSQGFAPIIILIVLVLIAGGAYYFGTKDKTTPSPVATIQLSSSPTASQAPNSDLANWKTYTNIKYGYSVQFPVSCLVGYYDGITGEIKEAGGKEYEIDFYKPTDGKYNDFLEIGAWNTKSLDIVTLADFANERYQSQKSSPKTTEISGLDRSKFAGFDAYEFTFSGDSPATLSIAGGVPAGKYKIIIFQKGVNTYFLSLKNDNVFNQILSTFKFTQ